MDKRWRDAAWEDYVALQSEDNKTLRQINALIKDIERNGAMTGIGKPESLKYGMGYSRRIDDNNRLVYSVDKRGHLDIKSCRGR